MSKSIGEILNSKRRELGFSQAELASALAIDGIEVTNQAISKWETGSTLPNARQFLALCRALEIDDISGTFDGGSRGGLLAGLNTVGRKKALDYIELLRDSGRYGLQPEPVKTRTLPLYSLAVSAGTGQFLDSEDYDMTEVGPEVPDGANFGVRVAGDSMEPRFHDGQTVWVSQQYSLMTGEIGIFLYDGCAYLKQLVAGDGYLALHSLNPAYPDIRISPALPLRVLGKLPSRHKAAKTPHYVKTGFHIMRRFFTAIILHYSIFKRINVKQLVLIVFEPVLFSYLSYHAAWYTRSYRHRRYIPRNNATRAYNRTVSDRYSGVYDDSCSQPHVISYADRAPILILR